MSAQGNPARRVTLGSGVQRHRCSCGLQRCLAIRCRQNTPSDDESRCRRALRRSNACLPGSHAILKVEALLRTIFDTAPPTWLGSPLLPANSIRRHWGLLPTCRSRHRFVLGLVEQAAGAMQGGGSESLADAVGRLIQVCMLIAFLVGE